MAAPSPPPSSHPRMVPAMAITEGMRRVRSRIGEFGVLAALPAFVSALLTAVVPALAVFDATAQSSRGPAPTTEQMLGRILRPDVLASLGTSFLVECVTATFVVGLALALVRGDRRPSGPILRSASRRIMPFVGWMIVVRVAIVAGLAAFIVGAVVAAFVLQLIPFSAYDGGGRVLGRGLRTMADRLGALIFINAYQFLSMMCITLLASGIATQIYDASGRSSAALVIVAFVNQTALGLVATVFVVAKARLYVDAAKGQVATGPMPLPEVPASAFGPWPGAVPGPDTGADTNSGPAGDAGDPPPPASGRPSTPDPLDPIDRPPSPN